MYDQKIESVTDKSISAMFAFWSAMLTAHTVILSVAAAVITTGASSSFFQFKLIAFIATACMVLLLLNFAALRMQYEAIGRRLVNLDSDLSESDRVRDLRKANIRRISMRVVEAISALGLAIEACLLAWVLVE
jgi:hypothetical protein